MDIKGQALGRSNFGFSSYGELGFKIFGGFEDNFTDGYIH